MLLKFESYVLNINKVIPKIYAEETWMAGTFEEISYEEEPVISVQNESCPGCIGKK